MTTLSFGIEKCLTFLNTLLEALLSNKIFMCVVGHHRDWSQKIWVPSKIQKKNQVSISKFLPESWKLKSRLRIAGLGKHAQHAIYCKSTTCYILIPQMTLCTNCRISNDSICKSIVVITKSRIRRIGCWRRRVYYTLRVTNSFSTNGAYTHRQRYQSYLQSSGCEQRRKN